MLPRVKIHFETGALGQVAEMADGCLGLLALGAKVVSSKFSLGTAYKLKSLASLEALGVTAENNPLLHKNVKEFYEEAGNGCEVWLMGFADTATLTNVLDPANAAGANALILASGGKIRGLVSFKATKAGYAPEIKNGLDNDVYTALAKAQLLGEWATDERYAPVFTLIEGYAFSGKPEELTDLHTMSNNRAGIVIGDTVAGSKNAAMGLVAGRIAASPVQRKISRVKSGALAAQQMYIGSVPVDVADVESIDEKGFITFRTFVGKAGYFIADDHLASAANDDYNSISNRRVIDKAYRVAYGTLLSALNDELPVSSDGLPTPAWCASIESDVETDIIAQMTANGNLGNDPTDVNDSGVECTIDRNQNILSGKKIEIGLRVKPKGYAKYLDVKLGFKTS